MSATEEAVRPREAGAAQQGGGAAAGARVLLVDDQPIVAEAMRRMLAKEPDLAYAYCQDPTHALEEAARFRPTVILQDLVMPGVDGMVLLRFFRGHPATRDVPVIVMSSKEDPRVKREAFELGASDYLVKIPDEIELVARIRAHSRSYLAQRQRDAAYRELRALHAELEAKNRELERLSSLDGLTGIPNRRTFDRQLSEEWGRAAREGRPLGLILIDIDHFKGYNDHYGHQGGDEVLRRVARALEEAVRRPADRVARYGGEEFVVILPETDREGAATVAEALRRAVGALGIPHARNSAADHVTISQGVAARVPRPGEPPQQLVEEADRALYAAKRAGRNRYVLAEG